MSDTSDSQEQSKETGPGNPVYKKKKTEPSRQANYKMAPL